MTAPNDFRPIILIRGFDPLSESPDTTYYGFNDGTVYPHPHLGGGDPEARRRLPGAHQHLRRYARVLPGLLHQAPEPGLLPAEVDAIVKAVRQVVGGAQIKVDPAPNPYVKEFKTIQVWFPSQL